MVPSIHLRRKLITKQVSKLKSFLRQCGIDAATVGVTKADLRSAALKAAATKRIEKLEKEKLKEEADRNAEKAEQSGEADGSKEKIEQHENNEL